MGLNPNLHLTLKREMLKVKVKEWKVLTMVYIHVKYEKYTFNSSSSIDLNTNLYLNLKRTMLMVKVKDKGRVELRVQWWVGKIKICRDDLDISWSHFFFDSEKLTRVFATFMNYNVWGLRNFLPPFAHNLEWRKNCMISAPFKSTATHRNTTEVLYATRYLIGRCASVAVTFCREIIAACEEGESGRTCVTWRTFLGQSTLGC